MFHEEGTGFPPAVEEALLMTVASQSGFAELKGMLRPGGNPLVILPGENSHEVGHITMIGFREEWDLCIRRGGSVPLIIESFLSLAEPDLSEEDAAIMEGLDCLSGLHGTVDMSVGAIRSLETHDV